MFIEEQVTYITCTHNDFKDTKPLIINHVTSASIQTLHERLAVVTELTLYEDISKSRIKKFYIQYYQNNLYRSTY